jgi:HflK protein
VILNCVRLLVEGKAVEESRLSGWNAAWRDRLHRWRHAMDLESLKETSRWIRSLRFPLGRWAFGLVVGLLLISGITIVGPEEIAVVQRFGRRVDRDLEPGIHYRWPWPVETVSRVAPGRVQVVEIGYRTSLSPAAQGPEPRVYEWNTQHREGRYLKVPEEGLMLTGDENLVEVNAVVQYDITDPEKYLFEVENPVELMRSAAEQSLRSSIACRPLDAVLTGGRSAIEADWREDLQRRMAAYDSGLRVQATRLQDVHPPVEVVEAFRDVASALEEKVTRINEAESYHREQVPLARGQARARLLAAQGYAAARTERSRGDGSRFVERDLEYRKAPQVTALRLYFETIEQVLPNKRKYITDPHRLGQRRFLFVNEKGLNLLNVIEPESKPGGAPELR